LLVADAGVRLRKGSDLGIDVNGWLDVEGSALPGVVAILRRGRSRSGVEGEVSLTAGIESGVVEIGCTHLVRSRDALELSIGLLRNGHRRACRRDRENPTGKKSLSPPGNNRFGRQCAVQPLSTADRTARVKPKRTVVAGLKEMCGQGAHTNPSVWSLLDTRLVPSAS
jgi:hypothetical protein